MAFTRCHYATDPHARPHCELTATVRYGRIPLCPSCATLRSTLGKAQAPRPLPVTTPLDALDCVQAARNDAEAAHTALHAAVTRARQHGHPWSAIADRLGTTRQAAQQRFTSTTEIHSSHAARQPTQQAHP